MGTHYYGLFFYGLVFDESDYRASKFLKECVGYEPTDEERESEEFNEDDWYASAEWDGGVQDVDKYWAEDNDPVLIGRVSRYDSLGLPYIGIRETCHSTESSTSFDLNLNYKYWDNLLLKKCEKYGISWRQPSFHLLLEIS